MTGMRTNAREWSQNESAVSRRLLLNNVKHDQYSKRDSVGQNPSMWIPLWGTAPRHIPQFDSAKIIGNGFRNTFERLCFRFTSVLEPAECSGGVPGASKVLKLDDWRSWKSFSRICITFLLESCQIREIFDQLYLEEFSILSKNILYSSCYTYKLAVAAM